MSEALVPEATVARLPLYLRALVALADAGRVTVSSAELAEAVGVQPPQLRRDLSHFGSFGRRGVGYDVLGLARALGSHVGATRTWPIVVVGAGNLGSALARQFSRPPFRVVAVLDVDDSVVGQQRGGVTVSHQRDLAAVVAATDARIAVVATPAESAQQVVDGLVEAGIRSVLNFAPAHVQAPAGVEVRSVDLVQELQILAFHEAHRH